MPHFRRQARVDARCSNLDKLRELLGATRDRVASELSDNKHVEHLTRFYNLPTASASAKGGDQQEEASPSTPAKQMRHPDDLDPEALEFIEEMRRRRYETLKS